MSGLNIALRGGVTVSGRFVIEGFMAAADRAKLAAYLDPVADPDVLYPVAPGVPTRDVTEGFTLTAAYGHLAPKYLDVGQVRGLTLDSHFQRTPRNSFSGSADYQVPLRSGILELHADYSYRSREQFQLLAASNDQKGYGLLGARIAFRPRDDRWSLALFGTNLTDKHYRTAGRGTLLEQVGFAYSSIGLPRQIGLEMSHRF